MQGWEITISIIAAIALFVHSLDHFSAKLEKRAGDRLRKTITRMSDNKYKAFSLGFVATAVIQSSSAVLSIAVSFVDSGLISFESSLPIILGSNLGTTVTAWLVSLNIEFLGSALVVIGFILSYFPEKIKLYSSPIFYLGLILFSLNLIGENLAPIKESTEIIELLSYASNPFIGILLGMIITALTQSSSVTIGLAIILCDQGVMDLDSAIGIIVGSNLGTTSTAFIASTKLGAIAKRTAMVNLLFNSFGVLVYLPFYKLFYNLVTSFDVPVAMQAAYAHLIFNLVIALLLMPFIRIIVLKLDTYWARKEKTKL